MKINLEINNIFVVSLLAFGLAALRMLSDNIIDLSFEIIIVFISYYIFSFIPIALLFTLKRSTFIKVLIISIILVLIYLTYGKIMYDLNIELMFRLFIFKTIYYFSIVGSLVYVIKGLKNKQLNVIFIAYLVTVLYVFIDTLRAII